MKPIDQNVFLNRIRDVLEIDGRELTLADELKQLDEWDSLACLSVIAMIEDEYGIVLRPSDFIAMVRVSDIASAIEEKKC